MASPRNLLALASGRLTPLSRAALGLALGLLAAIILLVRPVHVVSPRLVPSPAGMRLLEPSSPWFERALLNDESAVYMSTAQAGAAPLEASQPDASPFRAFGSELLHDPSKPLAIGGMLEPTSWNKIYGLSPLAEDAPYRTLGQKRPQALPKARSIQIQIYSDNNEVSIHKDFLGSEISFKTLLYSDLSQQSPAEFHLGIDNFGLQSRPYLVRSSGDSDWDRRIGEWLATLPWLVWLKPGGYRVVVGP